jgi:ATP-dependent Lon protease
VYMCANAYDYQVLGAHRAGIKTVLLPWGNKKDVEHDLTPEIQQQIHIVFVQTIDDVLAAAFGKGWPSHRLQPGVLFDSRL